MFATTATLPFRTQPKKRRALEEKGYGAAWEPFMIDPHSAVEDTRIKPRVDDFNNDCTIDLNETEYRCGWRWRKKVQFVGIPMSRNQGGWYLANVVHIPAIQQFRATWHQDRPPADFQTSSCYLPRKGETWVIADDLEDEPQLWYKSSYSACNDAPEGTESMIDFYRYIAPKLSTTIVFNGDTDPCVSYEGTRIAIQKVGFNIIPGGSYRPWFYDKTKASIKTLQEKPNLFGPNLALNDAGAQFGGQVVNFEHNLAFATVHGSGHMVPQFRPQSAERVLNRLLSGSPFAPLLATDETLANMSDSDFNKYVDEWTGKAKKSVTEPTSIVV